jgi:ankyrin repeat protein
MIDLLINYGADVSLKTYNNETASDFANELGHKEIADILKIKYIRKLKIEKILK